MKLFTSYFYMIRFFAPNFIPLSTAVWDPKWYHNFLDQKNLFVDKNGVINGVRAPFLAPGDSCSHLCRGPENCATKDPNTCPFLREYEKQLNMLDDAGFKGWLDTMAERVKVLLSYKGDPVFCLIVHEAPTNPCSERVILQKRFGCTELTKHDIEMYRG